MMPSIAPSTRWWVDTVFIHVCLHFMYCRCILSLFALARINIHDVFKRHFSLLCLSLCLSQVLKNISWYTERSLTEISLGSLLILVVIRTIQFNMTRTRVGLCKANSFAFRNPSIVDIFIYPNLQVPSGNMYDFVCVCTLPRINISTPTVWLHLPTCQPSFVVSTSTLPSASSGEDMLYLCKWQNYL